MNITENCLHFLQEKKWLELNKLLSDKQNCLKLASDPIFSIFENNLVDEIKRFENENPENLSTVLARILQLNQDLKILNLTQNCIIQIAEYLFKKHPTEKYAKILKDSIDAKAFLENKSNERKEQVEKTVLGANLNIKVGAAGKLDFSKSIFNSPQEEELFFLAKSFLNQEIILPNISLSTIINSKITELLDRQATTFFYQSSIDLCIVDPISFKPIFFIELDSSWHDNPKQVEKDKMKDQIFEKAGLTLHRLRKKENKPMKEVLEIFMKKHYKFNKDMST